MNAMDVALLSTALAAAFAIAAIGGSFYEHLVVDPVWPARPDIIQPSRGGVSRKRFWIPLHVAMEVTLLLALYLGWNIPGARFWMLVAIASHIAMRLWSALDFIPKALAFERAGDAGIDAGAARRWVQTSLLRLPLAMVTAAAAMVALLEIARG